MALAIRRLFTAERQDPYADVSFEPRTSIIREMSGEVVFKLDNVMIPSHWSMNAGDILVQKYFRKAGIPSKSASFLEKDVPKWLRRKVPSKTAEFGSETDARQVFDRLAGCWTYWAWKDGLFSDEKSAQAFYDEMRYMLVHQMGAPNSPQWFNTGLHWAYGIEGGASGHHYYDEASQAVVKSTNGYERPQPHACFIQSCDDDLVGDGGIMDLWVREARLFKYGSGTGTNFSKVRGKGELLSGGGRSSGLMSWLKIGDRAAAGIKSGGTTRRAAKMVTLDVDHPDIEDFVTWKSKEEQKVMAMVTGSKVTRRFLQSIIDACVNADARLSFDEKYSPHSNGALSSAIIEAQEVCIQEEFIARAIDLAKQGAVVIDMPELDVDWQGEAYNTVSGQQSNNSVRVTNSFMEAVERGEEWNLTWRTSGETARTVSASGLWDTMCQSAWACADPGLQFDSTINDWHTCPSDDRINGSNPCSEYMFIDDTACNLASINLVKLEAPDGKGLDLKKFQHAIELWTTVLEISVGMAQLPSPSIARKTWQYRTLGLGYSNLGALLMRAGIPYDSDEGRAIAAGISAILSGHAYSQSARMAEVKGPFDRYEANKDSMMRVIRNHHRAAYGGILDAYEGLSVPPVPLHCQHLVGGWAMLGAEAQGAWSAALTLGREHGYRNAQTTCIAPTGTISFVMDCDTTGIEPDFSMVKSKKLAGGGHFTIINQSVPVALERLGYSPGKVESIVAHAVGTRKLPKALQEKLTPEEADRISSSLSSAYDLRMLVMNWKDLGFTWDQMHEMNLEVCGRRTLEGASHLTPDHYEVFDCSNACGGKRSIAPEGHIRMMAACQPYISGAISKTINMSSTSSRADVHNAYMLSWKLGIKAMALYRDGSKLSQPLSAAMSKSLFSGLRKEEAVVDPVVQVAGDMVIRYLSKRRKLPFKRSGYTQKALIGGHKLFLKTGEYKDGTIGEIFVATHKEGASIGALMNAFCIAVSVGLQHGVPLGRFVDLFTFSRFEPNGMVQGDDHVKNCTSVIDYIFRHLAVNYLDRQDMGHITDEDLRHDAMLRVQDEEPAWDNEKVMKTTPILMGKAIEVDSFDSVSVSSGSVQNYKSTLETARLSPEGSSDYDTAEAYFDPRSIAKKQGFEGDPCTECHQLKLVRNGSCMKCTGCGTTTGCS